MSKYEIAKPDIQFTCEHGVFKKGGQSSICYCTSRERAEHIIKALEALDSQHLATQQGE